MTAPTAAQMIEILTGKKLEPWQREAIEAMEKTDPKHLVIERKRYPSWDRKFTSPFPFLLILLCAILMGCGTVDFDKAPNVANVRTSSADGVRDWRFYQRRDLVTYCVDRRGTFTQSKQACAVVRKNYCEQLSLIGQKRPARELNAICNGWRPAIL